MIRLIKKYFRNKKNVKLFNEIEPIILDWIKRYSHKCDINITNKTLSIKYNRLTYHNKPLQFELLYDKHLLSYVLSIIYDNRKLYKKCFGNKYIVMLIYIEYILLKSNPPSSNSNSTKTKIDDPKSEKLQKLNLTLESYQKQYSDIIEWERINKKTHQDRLMVTSMIENVKDKIEKISKKV